MNKTLTLTASICLLLLLLNTSCHSNADRITSNKALPATLRKTYGHELESGPQDFEDGTKNTFESGSVNLKAGRWLFDDAILAHSNKDARFYKQSVRLHNLGAITTQFSVKGISDIEINHAVFGNDQPSDWQLWMSQDGGNTFRKVGKTITSKSHTLTPVVFAINSNKLIRFEIRKVSGGSNSINIDNVIFYSPIETFQNSVNVPQ